MSTNYLTYLDRSRLLGTFGFEDQQGWQITLPQNSLYEAPKGWIQVLYLECLILFNLRGGTRLIFCVIIIIVNPWLLLKLPVLLAHLLIVGENLKSSETLKNLINILLWFWIVNSCSCVSSALSLPDMMKNKIQLKGWSGKKKENFKIQFRHW